MFSEIWYSSIVIQSLDKIQCPHVFQQVNGAFFLFKTPCTMKEQYKHSVSDSYNKYPVKMCAIIVA